MYDFIENKSEESVSSLLGANLMGCNLGAPTAESGEQTGLLCICIVLFQSIYFQILAFFLN